MEGQADFLGKDWILAGFGLHFARYEIRSFSMRRIGIDLGGTKIEIVLTTENPMEVLERRRVPTLQAEGYETLVEQLAELIRDFQEKCGGKARVGLGIPGVMSPRDGVVVTSNILCLSGRSLQADLEKAAGCPVTIGNDANCFALIEALHGAGKGFGVVLGVILGTGMGGGVVYQGRVWPGTQGLAGEWGHSMIDPNGVLCYCGRRGCQEQYISGTGIRRMYREHTGQEKTAPEIHDHAKDGSDPHAQAVMETFLELYAQAMANLIVCFDPDAIVIGGGVSNLPLLYDEGRKRIAELVFDTKLSTQIRPNQLGDASGVYGAAALA